MNGSVSPSPPDVTPAARLWSDLRAEWRQISRDLGAMWGQAAIALRNAWRAAQRRRVDYVVLVIDGPLPERAAPPRNFWQRRLYPPGPLSVEGLHGRVRRLADADNIRGVVFVLRDLGGGLATLQSLRRAVERLNEAGKETVAYLFDVDLPRYYVATAARRVFAPPTARFEVLGLLAESLFFKDAMARAGIQADFVQIERHKTAPDPFIRSEMSPEMREQLDWLLDDLYEQLLADMAAGRSLAPDVLRANIDEAPFDIDGAIDRGLLDGAVYEDELAGHLLPGQAETAHAKRRHARLLPYGEARPLLRERYRRRASRSIGVVSVVGTIAMGPSRRPPIDLPLPLVGGVVAGEQSIIAQLRQAERRQDLAAVILHVDSRGGAALASDLIYREMHRLAASRPVVVYMNNTAASGGYYVSCPAQQIVAQPATLTGSIGVFNGRVALASLYEKLSVGRGTLRRGERAALYRSPAPMSPAERALFQDGAVAAYEQFKQVVATGRSLPLDELDGICEGRVWTGRQALAHGLVDRLGDFQDALDAAAALAHIPPDERGALVTVNLVDAGAGYRVPRPAPPPTNPAEESVSWLSWLVGAWLHDIRSGQALYLMPFDLRFW